VSRLDYRYRRRTFEFGIFPSRSHSSRQTRAGWVYEAGMSLLRVLRAFSIRDQLIRRQFDRGIRGVFVQIAKRYPIDART
jgi:hypothetical protein